MKDLVVYYSFGGNTKKTADIIAKAIHADVLELKPIRPMKKSGWDFFIAGMKGTFGMTTKLKEFDVKFEQYDRIIMGTPIWGGKCTPVINMFLKKCSCLEKINAVFTLSSDGDNRKCIKQLNAKLKNLQYTVGLADAKNPKAKENEEKLNQFVESVING